MVVLSVRSAPNQYYLKTGPASLCNRHILYNIKGKEVTLQLSYIHMCGNQWRESPVSWLFSCTLCVNTLNFRIIIQHHNCNW